MSRKTSSSASSKEILQLPWGSKHKNVGERSIGKNYWPVSLLSVTSKVFEKLVNNRSVDHLEKC